jgi:hypothetical protein
MGMHTVTILLMIVLADSSAAECRLLYESVVVRVQLDRKQMRILSYIELKQHLNKSIQ